MRKLSTIIYTSEVEPQEADLLVFPEKEVDVQEVRNATKRIKCRAVIPPWNLDDQAATSYCAYTVRPHHAAEQGIVTVGLGQTLLSFMKFHASYRPVVLHRESCPRGPQDIWYLSQQGAFEPRAWYHWLGEPFELPVAGDWTWGYDFVRQ
jgi:hypothetical protein